MASEVDEPPLLLGSWRALYVLVLLTLALEVAALSLLSWIYA
jgi:hypothetical protein